MIQPDDIHSLTDFQRNAKKHIQRLKKSGRPGVLTVNGKAVVVVQDAKSYQRLLDQAAKMEEIEAIQEGIDDMKAGRGRPADEFFDELLGELTGRVADRKGQKRRRSA